MASSATEQPIVFTQLPANTRAERLGPQADGMLRADYGDGARLVALHTDSSIRVLSGGFHSACDPAVSFNGKHILFAAKRRAASNWHIFQMAVDGSDIRQITQGTGHHRSPSYQPTLYTIVSTEPWSQLTFIKSEEDSVNEYGASPATHLYSCKLDGSSVRRLTYNLSSDMDPMIMPDGRLLLASWQRSNLNRGPRGRISLFGINIDGTDYAAYCGDTGKRIKHMPCTTTQGLVVFVENDTVPWDGAGSLACVSTRRPLHAYRAITKPVDGLFHSPSALPNGMILVSRRPKSNKETHGLYRLNPENGQCTQVYDSPDYHDIQAQALTARREPDGRSSVVTEKDPHGKLYCLNVNLSDVMGKEKLTPGIATRLRVLEGVAPTHKTLETHGIASLAQRRILGEIPLAEDGSFNVEIPASIPIELQTLDASGMVLQSCSWIWAKNHEPRGCIGCHEDGELTPENTLIDAATQASVTLTDPKKHRNATDFKHDVMPIIAAKCVQCHDKAEAPIRLTRDMKPATNAKPFNLSYRNLLAQNTKQGQSEYVHPGRARTSPVIWHIFGKNTSRPWDARASLGTVPQMPANSSVTLTEAEKQIWVQWIDLGAIWDSTPNANSNHQ